MEKQIRYLGDVQRLELYPGDTVVLTVDMKLTTEAAERIRDYLRRELGGQPVIILERGMKIGVLAAA